MNSITTRKCLVLTSFIIFILISISPSINADINKSIFLQANLIKTIEQENDLGLNILQKLKDICKNEKDQQQLITKSGLSWIEIESKGNGVQISRPCIFLPNNSMNWHPIIKYHYFNYSDYTKVRFKNSDEWINITGPQRIRLVGFIGYVNFESNFFQNVFKIHDITIHGYALRIDKLDLNNKFI